MKIIAILEDPVLAGGEFNQALNAILQMKGICQDLYGFKVYTTHKENLILLEQLGIEAHYFNYCLSDKLVSVSAYNYIVKLICTKLNLIGKTESKFIKEGIDLIYFASHTMSASMFQRLNYVNTVVDLCHRDYPEFPEIKMLNNFFWREQHLNHNLSSSLVILTASQQLSESLVARYGIDKSRLLPMPFSVTPYMQPEHSVDKKWVLKEYDLEENFFFYPAQFWAHKNHIRILEALLALRQKGIECKVVFSGGDKGNQAHIQRFVAKYSLESQVRILGFVPKEYMRGLYESCLAVTMPTYFGPTNLPPLEAWAIGKPLIYSSYLHDNVGDAAICVNPDSVTDLVEAMISCMHEDKRQNLIAAGKLRLKQIEVQRHHSELKLKEILEQFSLRRKCWE
ncbi:glycosyltransferase [Geotalea sp. SG265]|uniref:glycosyltransferase n=1 Tax=Geotalea sp. SG265 TaxID=2922867 RepID=UPI001FAE95B7|nr:glycosyltransferase [Geotalea sp. SG265]